jgi:hypothetical protein
MLDDFARRLAPRLINCEVPVPAAWPHVFLSRDELTYNRVIMKMWRLNAPGRQHNFTAVNCAASRPSPLTSPRSAAGGEKKVLTYACDYLPRFIFNSNINSI